MAIGFLTSWVVKKSACNERSLVGCSPWGRYKSNATERLHFHFSLSCIGEGNGNPLQCSCLENPRDRGAWWAAVYGVSQSRTRLKRLSSSSSRKAPIVKNPYAIWETWILSLRFSRQGPWSFPLLCQHAAIAKSLQSCPTL